MLLDLVVCITIEKMAHVKLIFLTCVCLCVNLSVYIYVRTGE